MAKPKLALIPAAQGSKFYSVLPSSGVGDFNFTRSGSATRINSQGLIESVANGVSRLNYPMIDGVVKGCPHHILEPQRTQLVTHSEDFNNSSWTKSEVSVNPNNVISPNGTLNADAIIESTTSNAYHRVLPATPISGTGGTNYSCSVYVKKKGDTRHIYWFIQKGADAFYVHIDMTNYVVNDSNSSGSGNLVDASITPVGNDWYRISVSGVVSSVNGDYYSQIYLNKQLGSGFNPTQYTGDGISGLYLWGWQLEVGSYPTSYIPTNGSSVTRSAETANGSGDAATFNSEQGVLMAEISALADDNDNWSSLSIGSNNTNNISIGFTDARNTIYAYKTNTSSSWVPQIEVNSITNFNKIALSYGASENKFWINGFKLATNNTIGVNPNSLTNMQFNAASGGENMYSNTKQIQYYDSALNDNELETLTSWVSFSDMAEGQLYTIE